jgi:hypothetical protein
MNVFRISVIVLTLVLIAGGVVTIRQKDWHYGYLINQQYDQYQRLQREITQTKLEVARYQSPDNLLGRLREMKLPLEGFGLSPPPTPAPTTKPAKEVKIKTKDKEKGKGQLKKTPKHT